MPGVDNHSQEARPDLRQGLLASKTANQSRWSLLVASLVDLVFPPRCGYCERVDWRWCPRCLEQLQQTPIDVQRSRLEGTDAVLSMGIPVFSTGIHNGILQSAVQALKYSDGRMLAAPLGDRIAALVTRSQLRFDRVVPVPLHPDRLVQRGYNQAGLIAERVGERCGIAVTPEVLHRTRDTRTQVGLDRQQRQRNMIEAFHTTQDLHAESVLLIDDVFTTGATLAACGAALRAAGAQKIIGFTVTAARIADHRL